MKIYINGIGSVSFQDKANDFSSATMAIIEQGINVAKQPSYKEMIPPAMVRRMAKGVKMGIFASKVALAEATLDVPDAILSGTGLGCLIDSEKFLVSMLENKESYLTPTSFIQSTHNTVGAQIALHLKCTGYNFTYVHQNSSFESALLDAFLQIQTSEIANALVGGVDEIGPTTLHFHQLAHLINTSEEVFDKGVNYSEGATFMVLDHKPSATTYAEIVDIAICNVVQDAALFITSFLAANNCTPEDIDLVVLGESDTQNDGTYFKQARTTCFKSIVETYKLYSGNYHTASAFGLQIACEAVRKQRTFSTDTPTTIKYVLVYNQFNGKDHSLILLQK